MKNKLTVDLIIPVWKPGETYTALLKVLKRQSYPINKIIIMNTEEEFYKAECYPLLEQLEVHHIKKKEFDHGGTRNQGVGYSNADILLFLTQDAVPSGEYMIENMLKPFKEPHIAAVYGRQLPRSNCDVMERFTRSFNYPKESFVKSKEDLGRLGIKTYFCSNVCAAYRRSVYDELGGFPLHTIFNEDMIFTARVIQSGYYVAYAADARVVHSHNYSGCQQFHRNFDLAVSQADNPDIFSGIRSEGEGVKLVKQTASYLLHKGMIWKIPKLIYVSGCKYMGFLLGKRYQKLPSKFIIWCSMNKDYWKQRGKNKNYLNL